MASSIDYQRRVAAAAVQEPQLYADAVLNGHLSISWHDPKTYTSNGDSEKLKIKVKCEAAVFTMLSMLDAREAVDFGRVVLM